MPSRIDFELAPGQPVLVAVEPDRGLADALDQVEHVGALLVAHGIAQDAPEQPDVVAQPRVFLERGSVLGTVGAALGLGRHGLGRHGWLLQRLPGSFGVCKFFAAAQDEVGGGAHSSSRLEPYTRTTDLVTACHALLRRKARLDARGSMLSPETRFAASAGHDG